MAKPISNKTKIYIIVTGPFSSGKTSFARAVYEMSGKPSYTSAFNMDRNYYSEGVAQDFAQIETQNALYYFITSPGARRFDTFFDMATDGKIACVVLVDSAKPETFRETKSILETFRAYAPMPHVVAANKQDLPDAWDTDDLRIALRLSDDIAIAPCSIYDKKSVANVLTVLWLAILKNSQSDEAES